MQFNFHFKHMDTSDALQGYVQSKLQEKIDKFVTKPIGADVFFSVLRHQHTVHVSLQAGDGFSIEVENTAEDMYAAVDGLVDKLSVQLQKRKEKLKDHKNPRLVDSLSAIAPKVREESVDAADILKYEDGRRRAGAQ